MSVQISTLQLYLVYVLTVQDENTFVKWHKVQYHKLYTCRYTVKWYMALWSSFALGMDHYKSYAWRRWEIFHLCDVCHGIPSWQRNEEYYLYYPIKYTMCVFSSEYLHMYAFFSLIFPCTIFPVCTLPTPHNFSNRPSLKNSYYISLTVYCIFFSVS